MLLVAQISWAQENGEMDEKWETQVFQENHPTVSPNPSPPASTVKYISPHDDEFFAEIDHLGIFGKKIRQPVALPEVQKEDLLPEIYYGVIKPNTIIRKLNTNEHYKVGRTIIVRAQREKFYSTNAYLLDHQNVPVYEIFTHEIRSLTSDLDILPQPKEYQEYKIGRKFYHTETEIMWVLDLLFQYQSLYVPYYQQLSGVDTTGADASAINPRVMLWSNPYLLYGIDVTIQNGELGKKAPFFTWAHYFFGPALRYVFNPKTQHHFPKYHLFCSYQQSYFSQGRIGDRLYELNANLLNIALEMTFEGQWSDVLIGISRKY